MVRIHSIEPRWSIKEEGPNMKLTENNIIALHPTAQPLTTENNVKAIHSPSQNMATRKEHVLMDDSFTTEQTQNSSNSAKATETSTKCTTLCFAGMIHFYLLKYDRV